MSLIYITLTKTVIKTWKYVHSSHHLKNTVPLWYQLNIIFRQSRRKINVYQNYRQLYEFWTFTKKKKRYLVGVCFIIVAYKIVFNYWYRGTLQTTRTLSWFPYRMLKTIPVRELTLNAFNNAYGTPHCKVMLKLKGGRGYMPGTLIATSSLDRRPLHSKFWEHNRFVSSSVQRPLVNPGIGSSLIRVQIYKYYPVLSCISVTRVYEKSDLFLISCRIGTPDTYWKLLQTSTGSRT